MIRETQLIMGMPITLMTPHAQAAKAGFNDIFDFFRYVDQQYSPYIDTSDVAKVNRGELDENYYNPELREILDIAEKTKRETDGYFDVWHNGTFDPSGIVKGWSIKEASNMLKHHTDDFYIEAGGDIQVSGVNDTGKPWQIGIRNPFDHNENIAIVSLKNQAIATSGTAIRGNHIYNPTGKQPGNDIVSLSVIAANILDADRIATAAFAMGQSGIEFIQTLRGYEAYMVDNNKQATATSGWQKYEVNAS
jgi:thiamine biosynthesis lipoprotein